MGTKKHLSQLETHNRFEQKNKESLYLDFNESPRLKRGTGSTIVIHNRQQANKKERFIMVNIEIRWGGQDLMITYKRSQEIEQATCRLVACDYGFEKPSIISNTSMDSIIRWLP